MSKLRSALCWFCLMTALGVAVDVRRAAAEPVRRAVLIGVDEYLADEMSDLRGCGNDVDLMKSVLVGKFDFAPDDIVVLKDEEATRAGILSTRSVRTSAQSEAEGDIALVHYSGHGSQMEDLDRGTRPTGKDETIVPHDSRLRATSSTSATTRSTA